MTATITPRNRGPITVSLADRGAVLSLRRKPVEVSVVADLESGIQFRMRPADCGLEYCRCCCCSRSRSSR
jgi:hypothetical protein